jgi:hypothetical protein
MSDASGFELVSALADVRSEMKDFARILRADDAWHNVTTNLTVNRYHGDGPVIECYVDGERSDGLAVAWWLEAMWRQDCWRTEASLRITSPDGQNPLHEFGPRDVDTADELGQELRNLVKVLLQCKPPHRAV